MVNLYTILQVHESHKSIFRKIKISYISKPSRWNICHYTDALLTDSMMDLDKYLMDLSPTFSDFLNTVNNSAPSLFEALKKVPLHPGMVSEKFWPEQCIHHFIHALAAFLCVCVWKMCKFSGARFLFTVESFSKCLGFFSTFCNLVNNILFALDVNL